MSVTLKYTYRKFDATPSEAFPRRRSASRSVIPIQLINGANRVRHLALIDSGADFCVFHASLGEVIGLAIESGKLDHFGGISGQQQLEAYFHSIQIGIGGYEFNCWAGFSREIEHLPYGVLGQVGFFSLFDIHFDYNRGRVKLKAKA